MISLVVWFVLVEDAQTDIDLICLVDHVFF